MDPEALFSLINRYPAILIEVVYLHTRDLVEYKAAGPLYFRDCGESMPAYRALRLRS